MSQELALENSIFEANIAEWRKTHLGKFVLIKGQDVVGFYPTLQSAFDSGTEKFGIDAFLIKQIVPENTVNVSFYGKHLLSA